MNTPTVCEWFALCDNEATTTIPHPILGDVPTCERCAQRYAQLADPNIKPGLAGLAP